MLAMLRIQDSRASSGKKTRFRFNGKVVSAGKLDRSRKRFAQVEKVFEIGEPKSLLLFSFVSPPFSLSFLGFLFVLFLLRVGWGGVR